MTAQAAGAPEGVFARERQDEIARLIADNVRDRVCDL